MQGLELVCPTQQRAMSVHECCCLQRDDGRANALQELAECCCELRPAFREPSQQTPAKLTSSGTAGPDARATWTVRPTAPPQSLHLSAACQPPRGLSAPLFLQYRPLLI